MWSLFPFFKRRKREGAEEAACQEVRNGASAYLDGELEQPEAARIGGHLDLCPPCRTFMAGLNKTIKALRALGQEKAPDATKQAIIRRVGKQ